MKPSELVCFKDKKIRYVIIFLRACNKKFYRANATDITQDGNNPLDDWLKTGWARDSQTRTRLVDSLICITCSLENNAFSVLHYVMVALHYSMLHRFEIFSAPGTIAHGSIRLPPRSLASSRGCSLAISTQAFMMWSVMRVKGSLLTGPRNSDTSNFWKNALNFFLRLRYM